MSAAVTLEGAGMDQPLPHRPRRNSLALAIALVVSAILLVLWQLWPRGLQVAAHDLRVVTVERTLFRNDIVVRSAVAPQHTVMLDALETGRVEEILASDGALVGQGDLLFRLSNPQLRLDLVAREADRAQQIANLSLLRVALEEAETEHQRRVLDFELELAQARRQYARYAALVPQGYISTSTLEDSQDRLAHQQQALADERRRAAIEMKIKSDGVSLMEQAIERLDAGLKVVNETIEALAVRAPIAGRLTDFRLQLGEIVKPDQRIGRIDDPSRFKLVADIDEYFLGRVTMGKPGQVSIAGRIHDVEITRIFPQIKDGKFSTELTFTGSAPEGLNPGQSLEARITLGETSTALILPNDAFLNDSGGSWVYAVAPDGRSAERRAVQVGRRNSKQVEITSGLAAGEQVIVSAYAPFGNARRLSIQP